MPPVARALLLLLLSPLVAQSATFHVSQSGSDSTPCGAGPRRTINGGIACLSGGDTLVVGPGTYDEVISDSGGPAGYRPVVVPGGRAGAYTTIKAAQTGTVRLRATRGASDFNQLLALQGSQSHHIRVQGLVLDCEQQRHGMTGAISTHDQSAWLEFIDIDARSCDSGHSGAGRHILFRGGHYHGHGYPQCWSSSEPPLPGYCHGAYLQHGSGGQEGPFTFDGVTFSGNSGYGLQSYIPDITITNSVFRDGFVGGLIIVGFGGTVVNNCFERNADNHIRCAGCRQEGNRFDPPGGCGGAVPSTPLAGPPLPAPAPCPAPHNLRVVTVP